MKRPFLFKLSLQFLIIFSLTQSAVFATNIDEIRQLVQTEYVDQVDQATLQSDSVDSLLSKLDPYSTYFTAEEYSSFMNAIDRNLIGIGVTVTNSEQGVLILGLYDHGSAKTAGIQSGDIIIEANGKSLKGMPLEQAVALIKGKEGTVVKLKIFRPASQETFSLAVKRKKIDTPTVIYKKLAGNVGYIHLFSFNDQSVPKMKEAIQALDGVTSWLIDVQNNGGGYLQTAQNVVGLFPGVQAAVMIEDRNKQREVWPANVQDIQLNGQVSLLINQNSASASEILAGALQDAGAAKLYGHTTYGKGLVQNLFQLSDGSVLKLSVARFFTPKGNIIGEVGITPDVKTKQGQALATAHLDFLKQNMNLKVTESQQKLSRNGALTIKLEEPASLKSVEESIVLDQLGGSELDVSVYPVSLTEFKVVPNEPLAANQNYLLVFDGKENMGYKFETNDQTTTTTFLTFKDIKPDAFYTKPVLALYGERIIKGTGNGRFAPYRYLTRQDAAVMFARVLNLDHQDKSSLSFQDVPADAYYSDAIAAVKAAGIMNGRSASVFGTNEILTRKEMAALIVRAFNLEKGSQEIPFSDVSDSIYQSDIIKVYNHGIAKGFTKTTFAPDRALTRAEFTTFLYRAIQTKANTEIKLKEIRS